MRKKQEGIVKKLAYQDALTELPNRRAFLDKLEQQLIGSEKRKSPFAGDVYRFGWIQKRE